MKRLIAFSFFFALVCVGVRAQLPRNFFGATLGVSSKHQTIQALLAEKVPIQVNGEDYLGLGKVMFDGETYKSVIMKFYDDVLYKVCLDDNGSIGCVKKLC